MLMGSIINNASLMKLRVYERIISQLYSLKGRRLVVIRLGQIAFKAGQLSRKLKTVSKYIPLVTPFKS